MKTIIGLIHHPATVVKEYIGGNTKPYQNPISLFLTIIAISYLLTIVFERFVNIEDESNEFFMYGIVVMLIIVYAFLLQLFFPKSGYNYYERLILSTYMVTTFVIFQTVVEIASDFFPEENNSIVTISILFLIFMFISIRFCFPLFRDQNFFWLKSVLLSLTCILISISLLASVLAVLDSFGLIIIEDFS